MISVVLTRRELVNSRETVYTGGNEINMLDSKPESSCDRGSANLGNLTSANSDVESFDHSPQGKHKALRLMKKWGGWVIDHGDCYFWTNDEGFAIDLTLSLCDECRKTAERRVNTTCYIEGRQ